MGGGVGWVATDEADGGSENGGDRSQAGEFGAGWAVDWLAIWVLRTQWEGAGLGFGVGLGDGAGLGYRVG